MCIINAEIHHAVTQGSYQLSTIHYIRSTISVPQFLINPDGQHQHNGQRRGEADLTVGKGQTIDFETGNRCLDAGTAASGDVDDIEAGESGDDGDRDADADFLAQAGQGDPAELVPG